MDPLSQAVLGASLSQSFAGKKASQFSAMVIGALAGMAPDLDVLIASKSDPLLFLEFHRQFTHSLAFVPLGAFLCALMFYYFMSASWFKRRYPAVQLSFLQVYLFSFLGFITHGFLDAHTSYGTQLLWPFSDERFAWSTVSIIDPLFTFPLIFLVILSVRKRTTRYAKIALLYAALFLSFGAAQHQRAEQALTMLAQQRGHLPERTYVKPSFGNQYLWKMIYEYDGRYYVDAVKLSWQQKIIIGDSIAKLDVRRDFAWLPQQSQSAKDIERFRWFSDGFLALNANNKNQVMDVRNSILPNSIKPMWGIEINRTKIENGALQAPAHFVTDRKMDATTKKIYFDMLF